MSTSDVLWPEKYIRQEGGPPDWQKFVDTGDEEGFTSFLQSVPLPSCMDLYVYPGMQQAKLFAARLTIGTTLCILIWLGGKLCLSILVGTSVAA